MADELPVTLTTEGVFNKSILEMIYTNDVEGILLMKIETMDINFLEENISTDLDAMITPLAQAAFLGRIKIIEILLNH